jgi:type IV pilus assembly protein PilP
MMRRETGIALLCALLAGCGADFSDLQHWIAHQRQAASAPALPPLTTSSALATVTYRGAEAPDPFDARRLDPEAATPASALEGPPATELRRLREPLESFPLESLRMVGSLVREGRMHALVQAPGVLFSVRTGDRLGTNFG